jgi:hypothetical protein
MSQKKKEDDTVFIEGHPAITTVSPYENVRLSYEADLNSKTTSLCHSQKKLRLECIRVAVAAGAKDPERIMELTKRFWDFVRDED